MIPYRPVLEIPPIVQERLLLFVGHHSILAWGRDGQKWESQKLSDEGVTITSIDSGVLHGTGWDMKTDREAAVRPRTAERAAPFPDFRSDEHCRGKGLDDSPLVLRNKDHSTECDATSRV